ncbi:MAG TPA: RNA polymerase sigma factor [Candidatus Paceibacterota bacterium]
MERITLFKRANTAASDEELLRISLAEDPERFSELISRYRTPFLRKAQSILRNEEDAEDAVQETFVKIYIKGNQFRPVAGATFKSWGYKVLINTCLSMYRKLSRNRQVDLEELIEIMPDVAHAEQLESRFSYDAFLSVLSRLPDSFSSLLRKLVLSGKSPKQIALEEGLSENAIRTRFHRARKAFEKIRADVS